MNLSRHGPLKTTLQAAD